MSHQVQTAPAATFDLSDGQHASPASLERPQHPEAPRARAPIQGGGGARDLGYAAHYADDAFHASAKDTQRFVKETGVDPANRVRMVAWQKENGLEPTGALDKDSLNFGAFGSKEMNARNVQHKLADELEFYIEDREGFAALSAAEKKDWIADWQGKHGLAPTGVANAATVNAAQRARQASANKDGAIAGKIEKAEELNFYLDGRVASHKAKDPVDSVKLAAWQDRYGLKPTGVVDDATLAAARQHFRGAASEQKNRRAARENQVMILERQKEERKKAERDKKYWDRVGEINAKERERLEAEGKRLEGRLW